MNISAIEVNKQYPGDIPLQEKSAFDIDDSGPMLLLFWKNPSQKETDNINRGQMKVALTILDDCIFLLVKFGDLNWMDMPYNAHLSSGLTKIEAPVETQGYALNTILVDIATRKTKALRLTGLPHKFSLALKKAIEEQLKSPAVTQEKNNEIVTGIYAKYSTKELLGFASVQQKC